MGATVCRFRKGQKIKRQINSRERVATKARFLTCLYYVVPIAPRQNHNYGSPVSRTFKSMNKKSSKEMKISNRPAPQAFISGDLYLFHPTDRSCPVTGSLFGIFDKIADGILYLESSSSDLIHFRLWHRLPDDYCCCRRASRRELRDYIFNLACCECL